MAKTRAFVRLYNTYVPHESQLCMTNTMHIREYATKKGKFMQVYTKQKVDMTLA